MAKKSYIGVNNLAKVVKKGYIGVNSVARKVVKMYEGVNGVAKLVYSGEEKYLYGGTSTFVHVNSSFTEPTKDYSVTLDSFSIQVEKYDTTPLYVYFDDELVATSTTSGEHTVTVDGGASAILSRGSISVTTVSESQYGIGSMLFKKTWDYTGTDSKNNTSTKTFIADMKSATLSDNVVKLYNCTFDYLIEDNLSIPSRGLVVLGESVFSSSPITSFTIPETVTTIGYRAFYNCDGLTSLTIPNSVSSIGDQAFAYCEGLTSLTISNSVSSIGDQVIVNCSNLTEIIVDHENQYYSSVGSVVFNKACTELILYPFGKGGHYVIPGGVTSIGKYAFASCEGLTSIEFPSSVTSIGKLAFYGCEGLTSIEFPSSVTSIEEGAFTFCLNITSIRFKHGISDSLSIYIDTSTKPNSAFYELTNVATNVYHKGNASVLNYDWASCNRKVTFIQE